MSGVSLSFRSSVSTLLATSNHASVSSVHDQLFKTYHAVEGNHPDEARTQFNLLPETVRDRIYERIYSLAGSPQNVEQRWGQTHVFDSLTILQQAIRDVAFNAKSSMQLTQSNYVESIRKIEDSNQMILWELPRGIPDPRIQCEEGKEDQHPRCDCPRSIGRSCWIDVFQYILHGSRPVVSKRLNKVDEIVNFFRDQLNNDRAAIDFAPIKEKLLCIPNFNLLDQESAKKDAIKLINILKKRKDCNIELKLLDGFSKQDKNSSFEKYTSDLIAEEGMKTHEAFFKNLNVSPLSYIPVPILEIMHPELHKDMVDYPIAVQYGRIANVAAKLIVAQEFEFPASAWNPSKDISVLFDEVKRHGVIGFGGRFGKNHYFNPPHKVLKVQDKDIYGWSPNERNRNYTMGHFIAVVGVKKETSAEKIKKGQVGHVIYVDPNDGMNQRIFYIISYATFKECVNNEFGMMINPEEFQAYENEYLKNSPSLKPFKFGYLPNPTYVAEN